VHGPDEWIDAATLLQRLDDGGQVAEGLLVRHLRAASCPREIVQRLAGCRWARSLRHARVLLVRHPACPRAFAWDVLPRMGWHDLLLVVRDARTAPPIRRQAERRLRDRIPQLTLGERTSLARQAPRGVIEALLAVGEPACTQALLDNPAFSEPDAVRLLAANRSPTCLSLLLRHPRWSTSRAVTSAALRSPTVPLGVALGIVATLSNQQLGELGRAKGLQAGIGEAVAALLKRRAGADSDEAPPPSDG